MGTIQLTPFYRHTADAVRRIAQVDAEGILRAAFRNAATVDQVGLDANVSLRRGRLNGFGGGNVSRQTTDATNLGALALARVSAFVWSARANGTVKLTPTLDLQAFATYRAPFRNEQGRASRFALANLAFRQQVRGDKAAVTLRVADPFGTTGWGARASDGRVVQTIDRRFGARGAFLNVSYTFGQAPRLRPRPPEPDQGAGGPGGP